MEVVSQEELQAEEILVEQENLIKKVGGEITVNEDIINNSARCNMVAEVIDSYARTKAETLRTNVASLMAMTEETISGANNIKLLQQIAADYDLDSSYNNKNKLIEFLKQLEDNLNLMKANVYYRNHGDIRVPKEWEEGRNHD